MTTEQLRLTEWSLQGRIQAIQRRGREALEAREVDLNA